MKKIDLNIKFKPINFKNQVHPAFIALATVCALIIVLLAGININNFRKYSINKNENTRLTRAIADNFNTLNFRIEQSNEDYAVRMLTKYLTNEQIVVIAKKYWQYELSVNGQPVKTSDITVKSDTITISLKQISKKRLLPMALHIKGSATGGDKNDKFYSHIILDQQYGYEPFESTDETGAVTFNIRYRNLHPGYTIMFRLSDSLNESLGLSSNTVRVTTAR